MSPKFGTIFYEKLWTYELRRPNPLIVSENNETCTISWDVVPNAEYYTIETLRPRFGFPFSTNKSEIKIENNQVDSNVKSLNIIITAFNEEVSSKSGFITIPLYEGEYVEDIGEMQFLRASQKKDGILLQWSGLEKAVGYSVINNQTGEIISGIIETTFIFPGPFEYDTKLVFSVYAYGIEDLSNTLSTTVELSRDVFQFEIKQLARSPQIYKLGWNSSEFPAYMADIQYEIKISFRSNTVASEKNSNYEILPIRGEDKTIISAKIYNSLNKKLLAKSNNILVEALLNPPSIKFNEKVLAGKSHGMTVEQLVQNFGLGENVDGVLYFCEFEFKPSKSIALQQLNGGKKVASKSQNPTGQCERDISYMPKNTDDSNFHQILDESCEQVSKVHEEGEKQSSVSVYFLVLKTSVDGRESASTCGKFFTVTNERTETTETSVVSRWHLNHVLVDYKVPSDTVMCKFSYTCEGNKQEHYIDVPDLKTPVGNHEFLNEADVCVEQLDLTVNMICSNGLQVFPVSETPKIHRSTDEQTEFQALKKPPTTEEELEHYVFEVILLNPDTNIREWTPLCVSKEYSHYLQPIADKTCKSHDSNDKKAKILVRENDVWNSTESKYVAYYNISKNEFYVARRPDKQCFYTKTVCNYDASSTFSVDFLTLTDSMVEFSPHGDFIESIKITKGDIEIVYEKNLSHHIDQSEDVDMIFHENYNGNFLPRYDNITVLKLAPDTEYTIYFSGTKVSKFVTLGQKLASENVDVITDLNRAKVVWQSIAGAVSYDVKVKTAITFKELLAGNAKPMIIEQVIGTEKSVRVPTLDLPTNGDIILYDC